MNTPAGTPAVYRPGRLADFGFMRGQDSLGFAELCDLVLLWESAIEFRTILYKDCEKS